MHTVLPTLLPPSVTTLRPWVRLLCLFLCCGPLHAGAQEEPEFPPQRNPEAVLQAQARGEALAPESPVPPLLGREPLPLPATGPIVVPDRPLVEERPLYLDERDNPPPGTKYREDGWKRELLPSSLLWQPPLANPLQPRFRIAGTNLSDQFTTETLETAIGGTMPMLRWSAPAPRDLAWQLDFFGVALSRWAERNIPAAQDYRYGVLITGASGNWAWKIAYEHTSCHVGDEQIKRFGDVINRDSHIREEAVLGVSYTFAEQLRLYAIFGYAVSQTIPTNQELAKSRYNIGFEWVSATRYLRVIQPFAAFDAEFRGDQDYTSNTCIQLGIRIQAPTHRAAIRFGLEFYRGNSFYGQYFDHREDWTGLFAAFDY